MRSYPRKLFCSRTEQDILLEELANAVEVGHSGTTTWKAVCKKERAMHRTGAKCDLVSAKIAYAIATVLKCDDYHYGAWWRNVLRSEETGFWTSTGPGSIYWQWEWLAEAVAFSSFPDAYLGRSLERHAAFYTLVSRPIMVTKGNSRRAIFEGRGCRTAGINSHADACVLNPASYIGCNLFPVVKSQMPRGPERRLVDSGILTPSILSGDHNVEFFDYTKYIGQFSIHSSREEVSRKLSPSLRIVFGKINVSTPYTVELHLDGSVVTYIEEDPHNGRTAIWFYCCRRHNGNLNYVFPYASPNQKTTVKGFDRLKFRWTKFGNARCYNVSGTGPSVHSCRSEAIGSPVVSIRFRRGQPLEIVYG